MKLAVPLAMFVLSAPAVRGATASVEVPMDKIVQSLVHDLGAPSYDLRERSTEALRRIGLPALRALEKAAELDDPEVRVRARDLLADVRLGVGTDWPSELVLLVRHYDRLSDPEQQNALQRMANTLGAKAAPFLILRLGVGDPNEANTALQLLRRFPTDEVRQRILQMIREPRNEYETRALTWARTLGGRGIESVEAAARGLIPDDPREKTLGAGIQDILKQLKAGKPQEAAEAAEKQAKAEPGEARFLYLQAEVLAALDKEKQATALRERALALHPDKEDPHYRAAVLLGELGRCRLAAREWQRILDIEPKDSLYDFNAYLSLGSIHAASGLFEPATQYLDKALTRWPKTQSGGELKGLPMGLAEGLQRELGQIRDKAARYPAPADAAIEDPPGQGEIGVEVQVALKEGKVEDLQRALAKVALELRIAVQPDGIDFLEVPSASLRYDKSKKQLVVLLHDAPACAPVPFDARAPEFEIAVSTGDSTHILTVDAAGKAEQAARFDKDYLVILRPGVKTRAYTDVELQINGAACEWDKALKGIKMDRLPEQLEIALEGTNPQGRRSAVDARIRITDSMIKVPAPPNSPAGGR